MSVIVCFILAVFFGEYVYSSFAINAYTKSTEKNITYVRNIGAGIGRMTNVSYIKMLFANTRDFGSDKTVAFTVPPFMTALDLADEDLVEVFEKYGVESPYDSDAIARAKLSPRQIKKLNRDVYTVLKKDHPILYEIFNFTTNYVSLQNTYSLQFAAGIKTLFNMSTYMYGLVIILTAVFGVLFSCFVGNPLKVGRSRFFTENASYSGTRATRMLFLYRQGYFFKPSIIMALRSVLLLLWGFTVVGFPIAYYRYKMIPFILAENPTVGVKDAFRLSSKLMKKNKWHAFLLDLSLIGWKLLSIVSLGLVGILFTNSYASACEAQLYLTLRRNAITADPEVSAVLCDKYLDITALDEQQRTALYYENQRAKARREQKKLKEMEEKELRSIEYEMEREKKLQEMKYDIDIKKLPQAIKEIPKKIKEDIPAARDKRITAANTDDGKNNLNDSEQSE